MNSVHDCMLKNNISMHESKDSQRESVEIQKKKTRLP